MTSDIGKEFMLKTQIGSSTDVVDQQKGLPPPPVEIEPDKSKAIIKLPSPETIQIQDINLKEAIKNRISRRKYRDKKLTLDELSYLLWSTQGVKKVLQRPPVTLRTVPSAGARHAFETYLLINKIESLTPGLYRYLALEHAIQEVDLQTSIADKITNGALGQKFVKKSAVTFLWVAVVYRMQYRYGERGYRYLHLDAGHVCQNLYLSAEAINGGVCAIAAFDDRLLNDLLGLDGEEQFVIYLATVGRR